MSQAPDPAQPNPFSDTTPYHSGVIQEPTVRRPGGLTAIAIVAVVIGVLGLLSSGAKMVNLAFGSEMQQMFAGFGAVNEEMQQAQEEMNAALMDVVKRFSIPNTILAVSQFFLSIALVYGGIKSLKVDPLGRKVLVATFSLLLLYEVGQLIAFVLMQLGMMPVMQLHMERVMRSSPGPNHSGTAQFGAAMARFSLIAGIVFQGGWTLVKMVFYGFSIHFLRRQRILALFTQPSKDAKSSQAS